LSQVLLEGLTTRHAGRFRVELHEVTGGIGVVINKVSARQIYHISSPDHILPVLLEWIGRQIVNAAFVVELGIYDRPVKYLPVEQEHLFPVEVLLVGPKVEIRIQRWIPIVEVVVVRSRQTMKAVV